MAHPPAIVLSRPVFASGTLEALKWLAVVLMVLDHVNTFLYGGRLPGVYQAARIVMPTFGFILAYHLARPDALADGMHGRVMKRLAIFGLLATPMFVAMVGWWPLNILFTLLLSVLLIWLIDSGGPLRLVLAALLFAVGGAFVEFLWPGLLYCVAAWAWCRQPSVPRLLLWIGATGALAAVNRNYWAMAALPLIVAAAQVRLPVARWRHVFYAVYPAHLAVILGIQRFGSG